MYTGIFIDNSLCDNNSSLRNPFKRHLEATRKLDVLKFWEYAEDFRSNFDKEQASSQLSSERKNQFQMWITKIIKLQVEMSQCIEIDVKSYADENNPNSGMFYSAQQIAWTRLLVLFQEYSGTNEYNRIILQMLNEKVRFVLSFCNIIETNSFRISTM